MRGPQAQVLKIGSEDAAWEVLESALDQGFPEDVLPLLDFENWPHVQIRLPATPIKGSISPSMMEAFIELQKTIYRAHTLLTADTGDLRALSKAEKDTLEFHVKVSDGSSDYDVDLTTIAQQLGREAITKMDSTHIVITVLGIAVIVGAVVAFRAWLKAKADTRVMEIDDEDRKRWFQAHQALLKHDAKKWDVLGRAMRAAPMLEDVEAAAEGARQELVKGIAGEGGGTVAGIELESDFAAELVSQKRQSGEQIRLAGIYRVAKVDTTLPDGFRVTLADPNNGKDVTATMQDTLLSAEQRAVIRAAEWDKKPVFVEMSGRRLRNRTVDAVIISAREARADELTRARG